MLPSNLFTDNTAHAREVELADGTKHTLHFKELSVTDFRKYTSALQSEIEDERAAAVALLLSMSVCDEHGKLCLPVDRAKTVKPKVAEVLVAAVMDVNGFTKKGDAKN